VNFRGAGPDEVEQSLKLQTTGFLSSSCMI
jgi:hypothetical protein